MEKSKKKYKISELTKVYDNYSRNQIDIAEKTVIAAIFSLLGVLTVWLPVLPLMCKTLSQMDKYQSYIYGVLIPTISFPISIKNIIEAIAIKKENERNYNILIEGLNDDRNITTEELNERIEEYIDRVETKKYRVLNIKR